MPGMNISTGPKDSRTMGWPEKPKNLDLHVISYGGGVNSTAMILEIAKRDDIKKYHIVFADTGAERPETYLYLPYFKSYLKSALGVSIRTVRPKRNLFKYASNINFLPSRLRRWCTTELKISPITAYIKRHDKMQGYQRPIFQYIGIHAGEAHRKGLDVTRKTTYKWPLIDWNINQEGCVKIIKDHGLIVPPKSGCFCCIFASRKELLRRCLTHPRIMRKAARWEATIIKNRNGDRPFYLMDKWSLWEIFNDAQNFDFHDNAGNPGDDACPNQHCFT